MNRNIKLGGLGDFHAGLPEVRGSNPGKEKEFCLCIFAIVIL